MFPEQGKDWVAGTPLPLSLAEAITMIIYLWICLFWTPNVPAITPWVAFVSAVLVNCGCVLVTVVPGVHLSTFLALLRPLCQHSVVPLTFEAGVVRLLLFVD